jgi:hypothetical protein
LPFLRLGWIGSEPTSGHPVIISGLASSKMGLLGMHLYFSIIAFTFTSFYL